MTDLKKFIKLYKGFGVKVKVNKDYYGYQYIIIGEGTHCDNEMSVSELFSGYPGFYSKIIFNPNGLFVSQEFLE